MLSTAITLLEGVLKKRIMCVYTILFSLRAKISKFVGGEKEIL
ncbi:hypothetical protein M130_3359 [Bacteroides fragilis str. S6R6]|nr:hypothetical protein M130_3359 [Bacteroides fragilis str. S6R6]